MPARRAGLEHRAGERPSGISAGPFLNLFHFAIDDPDIYLHFCPEGHSVSDKRDQLIEQGFCVFEQVVDKAALARAVQATDRVLAAQPQGHFEAQKSTGSMINTNEDPGYSELIAYPGTLKAFAALGYPKPKFSAGYVISKPPKSPRLFWHQDWWGWTDPTSYADGPKQVFVMYYLIDTNHTNGCLRLLPGSHRKRNRLHDELTEPHAVYRRIEDPTHLAYSDVPGEIDVEVRASDVVIGDARILHAAHANDSSERRTVITLWFFPDFEGLSEDLQASMNGDGRHNWPENWPADARARIDPLRPIYTGSRKPIAWNRIPGPALQ
jgi:ectoine hydroxylase-related dioxygenase (phytanoyl-CoA dioxygenase family)